jgi:RNA polymerase-binding transcription factor DksA
MATKKPNVKKAAKKATPAKAKVVKKSAPVKKVVKPTKKVVKPTKKVVKPTKKVVKPTKKVVKPVKKVVSKSAPKAKKPTKKVVKPTKKIEVKKAAAKTQIVKVKKTVPAKKVEVKKAVPSPVKAEVKKPQPAPTPAKKAEVKKAVPVKVEIPKKVTPKNAKDIKIAPAKPVVLPKFATKTARTYQPDFMKSVLDKQKNDPGSPSLRYSDAELLEFRELVQRKLEVAKKELNYLQGLITRKDETGGDESENRYMTMEDGSLSMEREQLSQMASRQITFIDHLEKALMRIENKTYGICRVTGKLIDKARLRAVPHATLSIEAKMGIVK